MARVTPKYKIELARTLRREQTPSEAKLWNALRRNQLGGLSFRRQHPIGRYISDFCCESKRLVVEVDGKYHESLEQQENDREREAFLLGSGYTILRFTVYDVTKRLELVLESIAFVASRENAESQVINGDFAHESQSLPSPGTGESGRRPGGGQGGS